MLGAIQIHLRTGYDEIIDKLELNQIIDKLDDGISDCETVFRTPQANDSGISAFKLSTSLTSRNQG